MLLLFLHGSHSDLSNNRDWRIIVGGSSHLRIPRPSNFVRDTVYIKTDILTLSGRMVRDIAAKKEKFLLEWELMSELEAEAIMNSIIEENEVVEFEVDDGNLQIARTSVIPYMTTRSYETPGGSYYLKTSMELIEVE